jgi:cytochrome c oxidase assembly protein subunit 15
LLALGAVVTTFHVGMADPIWPTYPWHLMLISWEEPKAGFLIEHTHRLAGYIVGCCVIVLTVGLWMRESRRWMRWLGTAALAGVIVQGLLGGFRVKLDEMLGPNLALIHGCFASVVFSLLVSLAVCTSRSWTAVGEAGHRAATVSLRRWSLATVALVFLQILLGGFLRHTYSTLGQRGHLLVAFAVVVGVVWLVKEIVDQRQRERHLVVWVALLGVLVGCQLFLGVEAWMFKYLAASALASQAVIRTAHVLMGWLILAAAVVVTLQTHRRTGPAVRSIRPAMTPAGQLEEVA